MVFFFLLSTVLNLFLCPVCYSLKFFLFVIRYVNTGVYNKNKKILKKYGKVNILCRQVDKKKIYILRFFRAHKIYEWHNWTLTTLVQQV